MKLSNLVPQSNLGVRASLVVAGIIAIMHIVTFLVLDTNLRHLTADTAHERLAQETIITQTQFKSLESRLLTNTRFLVTLPDLASDVAKQNVARIRTNILVALAPFEWDDFDVVDANGTRLVTEGKGPSDTLDTEQEDALLARGALGIETTAAIVERHPATGAMQLRLAAVAPIRDGSGRVVGVFLMSRSIDDAALEELNFSRGEQISLLLVSGQNVLATNLREPSATWLAQDAVRAVVFNSAAITEAERGRSFYDEMPLAVAGDNHMLVHTSLPLHGKTSIVAVILVDLANQEAFQEDLVTTMSVASIVIGLGAILGILYFVGQQIVMPLRRLQINAEKMARGEYGQRARLTQRDEIGHLAESFNGMAEAIEKRNATLVQVNAKLQTEVADRRTAEAHSAAFAALGQRLNTTTNPEQAAEAITEIALRLVEWDACFVQLYLPAEEAPLRTILAMDVINGQRTKVPLESLANELTPTLRRTIEEGGQLLLRTPAVTTGVTTLRFGDTARPSASLIFVPIHNGTDVIGVWSVQSYTHNAFSMADLSTMQALADHCGGALERMRAEEQLVHNSLYDALTSLPNRVLFMERLGRAVERAKRREDYRFATLFMDLDRFKIVNDSLGHPIGDQLLIAISRRLELCVREMDTVARLSGDEFVILLEDIGDIQQVTRITERIQRDLMLPFHLNDQKIFTSGSIGVVLAAADYACPEDVVRDADIAMYRAKSLGKARYEIFDATMRDHAQERMELETTLRHAFERQEFELYYQPIVSLKDQKIVGVEALARWKSPTRGMVAPAVFIPVAEETGLIIPLGRWILSEACRQAREWQIQFPADPPLTMSVNLSARQFQQPDLVDQIEDILLETGLDAHSLHLEITESVLMDESEIVNNALARLHDLGILVQIDDFGTGYSSFGYLQRFPISALKIDRSFISNMGINNNAEIVRTILALAHDMGLPVIAEGVETQAQAFSLNALDCQYGQGYLYARPLDRQSLNDLLAKSSVPESDSVPVSAHQISS